MIRDRVIQRIDEQIAKGINKYGIPLDQNEDEIIVRLEHLAQELTDGLQYIEWIKEKMQRGKADA